MQFGNVSGLVARIARQIFMGSKLGRIDED
jgi:hypothetical protein